MIAFNFFGTFVRENQVFIVFLPPGSNDKLFFAFLKKILLS